MRESKFQTNVTKKLDSLGHECFYTVIQAGSIRGLPDIIGCYKGVFFGWELKISLKETKKTTGRIALQKYRIMQIKRAGGIAALVCPENLEENFKALVDLASTRGILQVQGVQSRKKS